MRFRWLTLLAFLVGGPAGCWKLTTLPPEDASIAVVPDGCTGNACGASREPDPFAQPSSCRAQKPAKNAGDALCKAGTLEVNCVMAPPKLTCPQSFREAAQLACTQGRGSYRVYCNACGGTTVKLMDMFASEIHFDESDQLVGVTLLDDDPVGPCMQREFVFGTHCSATDPAHGELTVSCDGAASAGSLLPRRH
jgi:hypothetical protein